MRFGQYTFSLYPAGTLPQFTFQVRLHAQQRCRLHLWRLQHLLTPRTTASTRPWGAATTSAESRSNLVFQLPRAHRYLDYSTSGSNCMTQLPAAFSRVSGRQYLHHLPGCLPLARTRCAAGVHESSPAPGAAGRHLRPFQVTISNGGGTTSTPGPGPVLASRPAGRPLRAGPSAPRT